MTPLSGLLPNAPFHKCSSLTTNDDKYQVFIFLLLMILSNNIIIMQIEICFILSTHAWFLLNERHSRMSEVYKNRKINKRLSWVEFQESLSDSHFYRLFCMNKDYFKILCCTVENHIGPHEFKSEEYIQSNLVS